MRNERLAAATVFTLAGLAFVAFAVPYLHLPMAGEHGVLSYGAWRMSLGEVLYRDFTCNDAPGIYLVHLAAHESFGYTERALRAWDLLWMAATFGMVGFAVRRGFGALAASLAVLFVVLAYFPLGHQTTAQKDGFVLLPLFAAIVASQGFGRSAKRDDRLAAAIGFLVALAFWTKTPMAALGPAFLFVPLGSGDRKTRVRRWWRRGFAMGAGFAVPAVAWLAYFAANDGGLDWFQQCLVAYHVPYADVRYSLGQQLPAIGSYLLGHPVCWGGLATLVVWRFRPASRVLVAATGLAFLVVVAQGKGVPYYLVPLHILLALLAGAGVGALLRTEFGTRARTLAVRTLAVTFVGLVMVSAVVAAERAGYGNLWGVLLRGEEVQVQREEARIAAWVRQETAPEDAVLVWGIGPAGLVAFLSKREVPTRWIMNYAFSAFDPDDPLVRSWRGEYMNALLERPPELVIVVSGDAFYGIGNIDSGEALERFAELRSWLALHYVKVRHFEGRVKYDVHRRKTSPHG